MWRRTKGRGGFGFASLCCSFKTSVGNRGDGGTQALEILIFCCVCRSDRCRRRKIQRQQWSFDQHRDENGESYQKRSVLCIPGPRRLHFDNSRQSKIWSSSLVCNIMRRWLLHVSPSLSYNCESFGCVCVSVCVYKARSEAAAIARVSYCFYIAKGKKMGSYTERRRCAWQEVGGGGGGGG